MNIEIDTKNDNPILIFRNKRSDRFYFHGPLESSDVAPGPTRISAINDDEGDGKFFMFWIADCMSPPVYVIRGVTFEAAYEDFIDWQVEQLKIEEDDLKDYDEDNLSYSNDGVPVDTESVQGEECFFVAAVCWPGDSVLWNLACMFLSRVTRYDNKYDETQKFLRQLSKSVGGDITKALDAFKLGQSVSFHTFLP